MLRAIPDDTLEDEPEYFRFWTRSEVTRIGCLMSLAIAPLSFAALDVPHDASAASRFEAANAIATPFHTGFLRSVRTVDFNTAGFDMKAMGDVD